MKLIDPIEMSPDPIEHSRTLHNNPNYSLPSAYAIKQGLKGKMRLPFALKKTCSNFSINNFLDYGCGKNGLIDLLKKYEDFESIEFIGYDPAVEQYSAIPNKSFDIVTCIDVLEHVSRQEIPKTLLEIDGLTRGFFFFAIDLMPAQKTLADNRNAHITLAPADWWCQQIATQFSYTRFFQAGKFESEEKFPLHLFGWATNSAKHQSTANTFFDSIKILSKEWILDPNKYTFVTWA